MLKNRIVITPVIFKGNIIRPSNKGADAFRPLLGLLKARRISTLKQHMYTYLNSIPYVSRKYPATVVLVVRFEASSIISNCNFSADWLDIPQTVYFLLIFAICVVSIRKPNREEQKAFDKNQE